MNKLFIGILVTVVLASCGERVQNTKVLDYYGSIESENQALLNYIIDSTLQPLLDQIVEDNVIILENGNHTLLLSQEDSLQLVQNYQACLTIIASTKTNIQKIPPYKGAEYYKVAYMKVLDAMESLMRNEYQEIIEVLVYRTKTEDDSKFFLSTMELSEKIEACDDEYEEATQKLMDDFDIGYDEDDKYLEEKFGI